MDIMAVLVDVELEPAGAVTVIVTVDAAQVPESVAVLAELVLEEVLETEDVELINVDVELVLEVEIVKVEVEMELVVEVAVEVDGEPEEMEAMSS
ncbi:MAG: hypothetical protein M1827_000910 [Pycnora praestabilis]|nr:MAG: hypothetical protein M1827_000910 [Pycnora praestabilis]